MKRAFLSFLIALPLLLCIASNGYVASKNPRGIQHKTQTAPSHEAVKNQQPQVPVVPLTILESVEATLSEAISTIKQQAITAQKQAEAYKETYCSPPVVINGVLALVGLGYLIFMGLQLSQIKKQTGIASDALILANRPRIKVRGFYVKADIDQDATGVKSWTMEVGYELVNHGGTEAIIIDSKHRLLMDPSHRPPTLRMPPDYGADQIIPGGTIINVGDTRQFVMRGTVSPEIQAELQPLVDQRQDAVMMCFKPYCIGFIAYKARIGNSYRTAFCRHLVRRTVPTPYGFETSTDPDYEYQD